MPRDAGGKNAPLSVHQATAEEYVKGRPGLRQKDFAVAHDVSVSALKKWVKDYKASEPTQTTTAADTIYCTRSELERPTLQWVRSLVAAGESAPTDIQAHDKMKHLEYCETSTYAASRKAAKRVLKQVIRDSEKYTAITRSVGRTTIPLRECSVLCDCTTCCDKLCAGRLAMTECTDEICSLGPNCGNRTIRQGITPLLEKRDCGDRGYRLFAVSTIEKDSFVEEYIGVVVSGRQWNANDDDTLWLQRRAGLKYRLMWKALPDEVRAQRMASTPDPSFGSPVVDGIRDDRSSEKGKSAVGLSKARNAAAPTPPSTATVPPPLDDGLRATMRHTRQTTGSCYSTI